MSDLLLDRVIAALGQQYEVEGEMGRGGMSVVYRARDRRLNRPVAIKVLPPELTFDPAVRMRFTREAQTSAQLSHPHIVPIYDVGDRDGIAYLVMALIGGGNLGSLLAREPRQSFDETRRLLREIADALEYAHTRGVIHRDIKPDNILLDAQSGRAMVTDFGIARAIEAGAGLTATGIAVGTPTYMSPEQAAGDRKIDGRSDIYSLGVVGYQMVTGRVPFTAGNSMALLLKHVTDQPRPIADLRADTPRGLRDAIERALVKSPEDRWPSAASLRDALAIDAPTSSWRGNQPEPVRYTSPRGGTRRPAPETARAEPRPPEPRRELSAIEAHLGRRLPTPVPPRDIALVPEHLASLTREQREDLRLWHGRIELFDRIKAMRWYTRLTLATTVAGLTAFAFGVSESPDAFPLIFAPIVPIWMSRKLWRRGKSLQGAGLKLRRVLFMPWAKWVLPAVPPSPEQKLEKLAPRPILESPYGAAVRKAADDRAAIQEILAKLSKSDRVLLRELPATADGLVDRVVELATMIHRLDGSFDPQLVDEVKERIAMVEREAPTPDAERRLALLQRQQETLNDLVERRAELARQIDSAGLALANLRLDLVRLRTSGLPSALSDVSTATQQARALSRDISVLLEAADEVRSI